MTTDLSDTMRDLLVRYLYASGPQGSLRDMEQVWREIAEHVHEMQEDGARLEWTFAAPLADVRLAVDRVRHETAEAGGARAESMQ